MKIITRCAISLCIATLLCSAAATNLFAVETHDSCNCNNVTQRHVNVCIAGTTYGMVVETCESNTAPAALLDPCSPGLYQDRISTIKKICFDSTRPVGLTNVQIIGYIMCDIFNVGCAFPNPNQWGFTVPNNGAYCWTFQTPRCTRVGLDGCINACGPTCEKCIFQFRWTRSSGVCLWAPIAGAVCPTSNATCVSTCEEGCPEIVCCENN